MYQVIRTWVQFPPPPQKERYKMNKTLCLVAVGKEYTHIAKSIIKNIVDMGYDIHLLTDNPISFSEFDGKITTYRYQKKIFNYLDKIEFTLRICDNLKKSVLYIDINKIKRNLKLFSECFEKETWIFRNYWYYDVDTRGIEMKYINNFLNMKKKFVLPEYITPLNEEVFFIPFNKYVNNTLEIFQQLKILFTYQTMMDSSSSYKQRYSKNNIGYGEGRLLVILFDILNIEYKVLNERTVI